MKLTLKTFQVENVRLEEFERLVYSRRYQEAGDALADILSRLKSNAGFAGYAADDQTLSETFTRLASAITALLADPSVQLTVDGYDRLALQHAMFHAVFQASGFENADHLVRRFGTASTQDPSRLTFCGIQNVCKLLISYSLDSKYEVDLEALFKAEPRVGLSVFLGMLSHVVVLSPEADRRRESLLKLGHLFEGMQLDGRMLTAVRDAYMHCSYAIGEGKHELKRSLNRLLSGLMQPLVAGLKVDAVRVRKDRPTVLLVLEWFHSAHAMYRCYAASIRALRGRFRLVAMGNEITLDDVAKELFDETIEFKGSEESTADVMKHIARIKPDIVYFPSVGMGVRCVALSSVRCAPIQIATLGHPASTRSDAIDYIAVTELGPGDPSCYSETVVLVQGMPPMVVPQGEVFPLVGTDPSPTVLRIAVPAMASKLNPLFLETCQRVAFRATRPIEFHFFHAKAGLTGYQAKRQLHRWLPNAVVHPRLDYNDYLHELRHCHLHFSPFPFGGTNSNIDSLRLGIPIVAMEGIEAQSQSDAGMLRHAGLPVSLIGYNPAEYERIALHMIHSDDYRLAVVSQLRNININKLFFGDDGSTHALDFAAVFEWIYENHERILATKQRFWRVADRKNWSSMSQFGPIAGAA